MAFAAKMAMLFPDEVDRLALVSVALGRMQSPESVAAAEARRAKDYDADGRPWPRPYDETARLFGMSRDIHEMQNLSRAQAGQWIKSSERGVAFAGLGDDLGSIAAPTLLMYGKGSTYERFREPALAGIPHVQAVTLDAGAFLHQQAPIATAGHILRWMTAQDIPGAGASGANSIANAGASDCKMTGLSRAS